MEDITVHIYAIDSVPVTSALLFLAVSAIFSFVRWVLDLLP